MLRTVKDTSGLSAEFKVVILDLMKTLQFPKQIRSHINENKKKLFPNNPDIETPELKKIQVFVNNKRRSMKQTSNLISDVELFIDQNKTMDKNNPCSPFIFGIEYDKQNKILLGDGTPAAHFRICMTSLKLLTYIDSCNGGGVYHIDGTYKLSVNNFV